MKILPVLFALHTLLMASPEAFKGTIEVKVRFHGKPQSIEYLSNGKFLLIRQPGDGYKRASNLIDLSNDNFTQIQHHNHSYTVVGKLSDWPLLLQSKDRPAPPSRPLPPLTKTGETKDLLGHRVEKFTIEQHGQLLEIWAASGNFPPFYPWYQFLPEPHPFSRLEEFYPALLRPQKLFPFAVTLKILPPKNPDPSSPVSAAAEPATLLEVTKITPAQADDPNDPALMDSTYAIPDDHRLMEHPIQQMKRREAELEKTNPPTSAKP